MSQTQPRGWTISAENFIDEMGAFHEGAFREEVRASMVDAEAIGHRLGGAFVARPVREEGADGLYRTVGWVFNWQSYVPAQRAQPPEPVASEVAAVAPDVEEGRLMVAPHGAESMVAASKWSDKLAEGWQFPEDEPDAAGP